MQVVITGLGLITSLGEGVQDNWAAMSQGKSGIHRITRFPTDGLKTTITGSVDFLFTSPVSAPVLTEELALRAGREAISQSGIANDFPGPLFLGMPPVEIEWPDRIRMSEAAHHPIDYIALIKVAESGKFNELGKRFLFGQIGETLSHAFKTKGAPISMSTACATGATAIQMAVEAIRRGECEAALAIGTDGSVSQESLVRFSLLSALSTRNEDPTKASRPFSKDREGFVMAEGAGALVLESYEHAKARGAKILGVVEGCGEMADSFHRTRSSPDGKPIIGCMVNALKDAGIDASMIDYVNAHGTSTPENDKMEYVGMSAVFGERLATLPVSSNKSMIGHTLSAAGAIEAVISVLTMQNSLIPPTINYEIPDPAVPLDVVPNNARSADVRRVISNSFGFGGQNVSLIFARDLK
jgi:3-oxoacyl-[acyl-carrier-protein] synthase II